MLVDIKLNTSLKSKSIPSHGKPREMFLGLNVITRRWQTLDVEKKLLNSEHCKHWFLVADAGSENQVSAPAKKVAKKKTAKKTKKKV